MQCFFLWIAALASLAATAGCGGGPERSPCYPVRGEVLVDGRPAAGVRITLYPTERAEAKYWEQGFPRGETDAAGKFAIGAYAADDGAPVGTYRALIAWPNPAATGEGDSSARDLLQGRYMNPEQSPWTVTVQAQPDNPQPRWELSTQAPPKAQPAPRR